ncbi:MAG: prepilin-type N-terminal cleavage/methylation domain-containing protein [Candidatus Riflebacteria bacterium]|nr:prepilin-type N-terminal cleavage/methylation domain-containing protein [Candidatus Riflebacteria bacterium]
MKRGFSLIELLVVVAIIAILVGVATPYYSDYVRESKRAKALQDLDVLKQAVVLFNSQEDLPYLGLIASTSPYLPILGENDFNGLMGRYLTYIPVDPWGKNYKLDPYACFVYSEGPSAAESDDIRDYYVKDLALVRIEWEDLDNNREMSDKDLLYFHFNKSVFVDGGISPTHFDIFENNQIASSDVILNFAFAAPAGYTNISATETVLVCDISGVPTAKIGVHSLSFKEQVSILQNYQEVSYDRDLSSTNNIITRITKVQPANTVPLRYAIRTNPIKVTPKNR